MYLKPKQKILVATFGGLLAAQGVIIGNICRHGLRAANAADDLLEIVTKHSNALDGEDLKKLAELFPKQ